MEKFGVELLSPKDVGLILEIEEEGKTLEENAAVKAKEYLLAGFEGIVMADDTGVEIKALGGEPGIHVRRWKDGKTRMSDQEVIDYCLMRMKGIPRGERTAKFRTVIALGSKGNEIKLFDGVLTGMILEKPIPLRIEGFPFESLFYIQRWKKALGEIHQIAAEQKMEFLTHREKAVLKAIKYLALRS